MPLDLPEYLASLNSSPLAISHTWEKGDSITALGTDNSARIKKLSALSFRALLGLRAALGEWMHYRFASLQDDQEFTLLNEAIWAASIDFRYLNMEALVFSRNDTNPVNGPMQLSKLGIVRLCNAYYEVSFGVVRYASNAASLVNYVLPDNKQFQKWFKAVVVRLSNESTPPASISSNFSFEQKEMLPRGTLNEVFGAPIPREVFNPSFDVEGKNRRILIDDMLVKIDRNDNKFLNSKEKLLSQGFIGIPYRYSEV